MAGIERFLGKSTGENKVERFERLSRGKSKEEVRELEQKMLVPTKLPPVTSPKTMDRLHELGVRIVFPDTDAMELFKRHFKVLTYVENNVPNIKLLLLLLKELDEGRIIYSEGKIGYATNTRTRCRNC